MEEEKKNSYLPKTYSEIEETPHSLLEPKQSEFSS